jgi:N-acetylneuraminate synthase
MSVFVIAEAGVNHNGDDGLALRLVEAAAQAGADAVKFQTYRAEDLATPQAPTAAYQQRHVGTQETQLTMLQRLQLSAAAHYKIIDRCRDRQIRFLSTPFDLGSLEFLTNDLRVDMLKIGSGDLTNAPLLLAAASSGLPIILSTGMAALAEIEQALGVLAFGYAPPSGDRPCHASFKRAFASAAGNAALKAKVTLLHCTTEYPAPEAEANLRAMETMRQTFSLAVGLSDHTPGIAVATAAVALGAPVIEKHLTIDRSLPGPDQAASLEPDDFSALVASIRSVEAALGDGIKKPSPNELKNVAVARKSLVARRAISKGEAFSPENLTTRRPGDGVSALDYFEWLGRVASRDYSAGEKIVS